MLISVYYIIKCVRIYNKTKKEYLRSLNDISEIVKEEKIIKIETHRRRNKKVEEKTNTDQEENKQAEKQNKAKEGNKQTTAKAKAKTQAKSNKSSKKQSKKKKKK